MVKAKHNPERRAAPWSRFAWHGWQLEIPANWNPVVLSGDGRRGSAVLADLESARLELTWVPWPGRNAPRLDRSVKRQLAAMDDAAIRPADHWPLRDTFADAVELICEAPEEVRLVCNSPISRRALIVRFSPYGLDDREAVMYRVAAALDDSSDREMIPWSVYGFHLATPRAFTLSASRLQTGGAYLSFRVDRSELVRFARVAAAGRLGDGVGPVDLMDRLEHRSRRGYTWHDDDPIVHRDHEVTLRNGVRPGWSRLRPRNQRHIRTATWQCPKEDRVFEVMRMASRPDDGRVVELLSHVLCHG